MAFVAVRRSAAAATKCLMATPTRAMGSHAGSVKWFNNTKGFGFITPAEEGSKDVFVHQSQIRSNGFRYLKEGEAVEYDVQTTDRGVVASDVTAPGGVPLHLAREDNGDEQM